jgi:hypothetical protein
MQGMLGLQASTIQPVSTIKTRNLVHFSFFLSWLYIVPHSSLVYNSAHANPMSHSKLKKTSQKGKKKGTNHM